jgi:hypothetical protein
VDTVAETPPAPSRRLVRCKPDSDSTARKQRMNIIELKERTGINNDVKLGQFFAVFQEFLNEIKGRDWNNQSIEAVKRDEEVINRDIEDINSSSYTGNALKNLIRYKIANITMILHQNHNVVPKNYYRNRWIMNGTFLGYLIIWPILVTLDYGLNISAENIFIFRAIGSLGVAFFLGYPIGGMIGAYLGKIKDKEAFEEGRQLRLRSNFFTYSYETEK